MFQNDVIDLWPDMNLTFSGCQKTCNSSLSASHAHFWRISQRCVRYVKKCRSLLKKNKLVPKWRVLFFFIIWYFQGQIHNQRPRKYKKRWLDPQYAEIMVITFWPTGHALICNFKDPPIIFFRMGLILILRVLGSKFNQKMLCTAQNKFSTYVRDGLILYLEVGTVLYIL